MGILGTIDSSNNKIKVLNRRKYYIITNFVVKIPTIRRHSYTKEIDSGSYICARGAGAVKTTIYFQHFRWELTYSTNTTNTKLLLMPMETISKS